MREEIETGDRIPFVPRSSESFLEGMGLQARQSDVIQNLETPDCFIVDSRWEMLDNSRIRKLSLFHLAETHSSIQTDC